MPPLKNQPAPGDSRNMIIAIVLSMAVFVLWWVIFPPVNKDQQQATQQAEATAVVPTETPQGTIAFQHVERDVALTQEGPRVPIANDVLDGSIRLKGARFDDINLKKYRTTLDPGAPEINLLQPVGVMNPYYAEFGWFDPERKAKLPGKDSEWTLRSGDALSVGKPVVLAWDNGEGLVFTRTLSIDADYMISVADAVENKTGAPVRLQAFGNIVRGGAPYFLPIWVVHQGMIGVENATLVEVDYDELLEDGARERTNETTGGWLGFTDHYWMAALVPDQAEPVLATFKSERVDGNWDRFSTFFLYKNAREVAPGASVAVTHRLFAGAKVVSLIERYTDEGVVRFDLAVDWGWFFFLTKPIFLLLDWLYGLIGNFGIAILVLTVLLKALFYPLANKSYESMTKMKKIQPEMAALRERLKDDPQAQQREMMALYRREKVNPVAGCLPLLLQIPVFFSLYKVLYVTIEMRHAPFFGWIQDLSAHDPTSVFNLFGLLPYAVPAFLAVGAWPVINGLVMWAQMKMNPPAPDPTQQKIFAFMPWIFMFMLATFPAGLVIYWVWNGLLSITQQYVIMRRMGVEVHLFDNLRKSWPFKVFFRDAKA